MGCWTVLCTDFLGIGRAVDCWGIKRRSGENEAASGVDGNEAVDCPLLGRLAITRAQIDGFHKL